MPQNKKTFGKIGVIVLMLALMTIGLSGIVRSYTASVPVSLTVPTSSLEISGYAAPGALVTIYDGANPTATATADSSGKFIKLISSIASGLHSISVSQQDPIGNESSTANRIISIPPQQLTQIEFAVPPTIQISNSTVIEGETITVIGYAEPNQTVRLYLNNQISPYEIANTSIDGEYSFSINTTNFYFGSHNIKTKASSTIGDTDFSKVFTFNVLQDPSEQPSESPYNAPGYEATVDNLPSPIVSTPPNKADINGDKATISGQAEPNARIVISINNREAGSVFANNQGYWIFDFYPTETRNIVTAVSCISGICSKPSEPIEFYYRVLGAIECKGSFNLENYRFTTSVYDPIFIDILYDQIKAHTISIDWGDVTTEKFSVNSDEKSAIYKHTYVKQGQYNGRITYALESDGCLETKYFTVEVTKDKSGVIPTHIIWFIVLGLLIAMILYLRDRYKNLISKQKKS